MTEEPCRHSVAVLLVLLAALSALAWLARGRLPDDGWRVKILRGPS